MPPSFGKRRSLYHHQRSPRRVTTTGVATLSSPEERTCHR
ncbi:unnamed protein product [Brassica rapa subsp. trilocularis]